MTETTIRDDDPLAPLFRVLVLVALVAAIAVPPILVAFVSPTVALLAAAGWPLWVVYRFVRGAEPIGEGFRDETGQWHPSEPTPLRVALAPSTLRENRRRARAHQAAFPGVTGPTWRAPARGSARTRR